MRRARAAALAFALVPAALAACSRGGGPRAEGAPAAPAPFDFGKPLTALDFTADDAARRLGSFEWTGRVTWSAARGADRTQAVEKHQLRQLAGGDFKATLDLDPGSWPGAETGREVIYAGGLTYARGRWAPFRERPTDRGRDARRFRDESFRLGGDLMRLLGPSLQAAPVGQGSVLGRPAKRYALGLAQGAQAPAPTPVPGQQDDADSKARRELVQGRVPLVIEGELLLDAETGVPMQLRLKGLVGEKADPKVRVEFDLDAQVTAWGGVVGPVAPPKALPDERKPRGVARALDQAGLRKPAAAGDEEPEDDE